MVGAPQPLQIRPQRAADLEPIKAVNAAAFAGHAATVAFDEIRATRIDIISLLAVDSHSATTIGHVLFSPVTLAAQEGPIAGMGLGQLAVVPDHQRSGVGAQLVHAGIAMLRARGCPFLIVIGHARYYPRFGFERATKHGMVCQWKGVPDDSFMVLFPCGQQQGLSGVASFAGI
jgi:putative acetyltransferase